MIFYFKNFYNRSALRKKIEEVAKKFNYNYAEETKKEFEVPSITDKVKEI
jgi:hypothetical protein